jgi:hypothetical protein
MKLGGSLVNVPQKSKKRFDIFQTFSPFSRVQFYLINCTPENGLSIRNKSSFYNEFFSIFVERYHMTLLISLSYMVDSRAIDK